MEIAGYQLGREVSRGPYSSVYNALDVETSITVSVRVFNHTLSANENFCNQFTKAVSPLIDQTIGVMVPVRQATANGQHCYLITDYFHGSQQQFESTMTFSPQQLLQFGQQLASTLELLHVKGLVHGGIESANVLFTDQSQVVLGFIALHKTLPAISHVSIPSSSLEETIYLAPEAQQGLTAATDFYALGILLYQLLDKKNPFDGGDLPLLELQKNDFELKFAHSELENLKPLFNQLLDPDPHNRITTAQQYQQAVEACGYKVKLPAYIFSTKPGAIPQQPGTAEPSSRPGIVKNNRLVISGVFALCVAVAAFFLLTEKIQQPAATARPSTPIIANKTIPPINPAKDEDTFEIRQAESLYQLALKNVQNKNYGSALMHANNALKENPGHQSAQQLKREIEREIEARAFTTQAEKQMSQGKLTQPPGNNAFESYQDLLKLLPANDTRAQQGLEKIAAEYYQLAKTELSKDNIDTARRYISSGFRVVPDYAPLSELEQTILQQQQRLARQRQQAIVRAAQVRKERERQAQLKQLEQQRQQQERDQRLAQERQQKAIKQQKISSLLGDASRNLNSNKLSLGSITAAKSIYDELKEMDPKNGRITGLKQDILDAYSILAISQKNASQYNTALITLGQGLSMDEQNQNLNLIKNEITALIALRDKAPEKPPQKPPERNNPLPVIGTF